MPNYKKSKHLTQNFNASVLVFVQQAEDITAH